jgi:hypothetical protein
MGSPDSSCGVPRSGWAPQELGLGQGSRLREEVDGDEADQAARDRDRLASGACAGWRRPHAPLAPIAKNRASVGSERWLGVYVFVSADGSRTEIRVPIPTAL